MLRAIFRKDTPESAPFEPRDPHVPVTPEVARRQAPTGLWWETSQFLSGDAQNVTPCPAVIDVTGRARFLAYGPFAVLEAGLWRATVFVHLCADAARRPICVQFGAEPGYGSVDLPRGAPGNHRVDIEWRLGNSDAAQVRLWLKKAAFHGHARLIGVSLQRIDVPAQGAQSRRGDDV